MDGGTDCRSQESLDAPNSYVAHAKEKHFALPRSAAPFAGRRIANHPRSDFAAVPRQPRTNHGRANAVPGLLQFLADALTLLDV